MSSPLPESLRIGPYTWKVIRSKKKWAKQEKDSLILESDGFADHGRKRIYLRPGLLLSYERIVFLHEILHACRGSAHLVTLDLNDAEESFINAVSPVFFGVFQDNPDLLDYLGLT